MTKCEIIGFALMLREFGFYYYFVGLRQNGMDSEKEVIL
jgi:hypothetical protein